MLNEVQPQSQTVRLTVIVPATNRPETLKACLEAIRGSVGPPEQLIVVEDPALNHPALARNAGARDATGDVLVFVDADVTVHPDALQRIRQAFSGHPDLAALFGSYDDAPAAMGIVSAFRNLLHHHVHQSAPGPATTFWAGLGAVRRDVFCRCGGFVEHPIEDIELGIRLTDCGARIILEPTVQGKHLKSWSLWSMLRTDLFVRGIPWVGLLLEHPGSASKSTLNLGWRHRLSALASVVLLGSLVLKYFWIALVMLTFLLVLNLPFYRLLARRQGFAGACAGIALHILHHLVSVVAVPAGVLTYLSRRQLKRARRPAL